MCEIAEDTEPIVDRDEYDIPTCQLAPLVHREVRCTRAQRPTVDPNEHGRLARAFRRPDVEKQTILTHHRRLIGVDTPGTGLGLYTRSAELCRVTHALPCRYRHRGCPAVRADGRQRVRNPFEDV